MLLGVALLLWLFAGIAKAKTDPKVRMPCNKKGPRLSLVQVGALFLSEYAARISRRFIARHFAKPKLTSFADLQPVHISLQK